MKMYPDDWRVRLTTGVVAAGSIATVMVFGPRVGITGFWPGMLAIVAAVIVGNVLGNLLSRLLFPPPPGGLSGSEKNDKKNHAP